MQSYELHRNMETGSSNKPRTAVRVQVSPGHLAIARRREIEVKAEARPSSCIICVEKVFLHVREYLLRGTRVEALRTVRQSSNGRLS